MLLPAGTICDVAGNSAGCWTDSQGLTGCSVVLCPQGAVVAADVRGGAPGTRET
ncbi:MAG TPA: peptidase S58 family protein, partial [Chloroflexota bacterium]|nr:peptidase S58 family protein [Chloroflexota bacterium]